MPLASGESIHQVGFCVPLEGRLVCVVFLACCQRFRARVLPGSEKIEFPIERLVDATVNETGKIWLTDGTCLRALEVIPKPLPYALTDLEWRITITLVAAFNAEKIVYRSLRKLVQIADKRLTGIRPSLATYDMVFDAYVFDWGKLTTVSLPTLRRLLHKLREADKATSEISAKTIAATIRKVGMNLPKRKRTQPSSN
jgi:hypothetical protein